MAQTARKTKSSKTKLIKTNIKTKKKTKLPARKKVKGLAKAKAKVGPKSPAKKAAKKVAPKAVKRIAKKTAPKATPKFAKKVAPKKTPLELVTPTQTPTTTAARVTVGDQAPDFSLTSTSGETLSLSAYRGKKVVLYFYPKDDTPGCTKESCNFRDQISDFEALDAIILGVSFDDQDSHQKFTSKYQLNFPLLSDTTKSTAEAYGVYVQKNMYGNISWGIERSTFVIDREGKIAAAFRKVSVDGHNLEVLAALKNIA